MRIDGYTFPYTVDRPSRQGTAIAPYRDVSRGDGLRREDAASTAASQEFDSVAQPRQVEQAKTASASNNHSPPIVRYSESYERPLTSRAAQALASYSTTASYASELDANEVLGLDLYA
jgi:hypothetical protein